MCVARVYWLIYYSPRKMDQSQDNNHPSIQPSIYPSNQPNILVPSPLSLPHSIFIHWLSSLWESTIFVQSVSISYHLPWMECWNRVYCCCKYFMGLPLNPPTKVPSPSNATIKCQPYKLYSKFMSHFSWVILTHTHLSQSSNSCWLWGKTHQSGEIDFNIFIVGL